VVHAVYTQTCETMELSAPEMESLVACFSRICMSERLELPFRQLIRMAFFEFRVARQVSTGSGLELTPLGRRLAPRWFIGEECGFDEVGSNLRLTLSRLSVTNRRHRVMRESGQQERAAPTAVCAPRRVTPQMAAKRARMLARSAGVSLSAA
jgi:hypothetical protein